MKQQNRKRRGYWTKDKCRKEALKYKKRSIFKQKSGGAYNFAKNNKILNEICHHMKVIGNRFKRLIYVYKFSDKSVYVGLTRNIDERNKKHMNDINSSVYKHCKLTGLKPVLTYSEYINVNDAVILEGKTVEEYVSNGYKILNKAKTGSVGGENIKWTFEKCFLESKKYKTRTEFAKKSESAYNASRRYGWLKRICSHMPIPNIKPIGYWTKEKCKKEACKFNKKEDFSRKSSGAYGAAFRNKWLNEICSHMNVKNKKPNGYWTKEKCKKEALKYNSKTKFQLYSGGAYRSALNNCWLNDICCHMKKNKIK